MATKRWRREMDGTGAAGRSGGRWLGGIVLRMAVLAALGGCVPPPTVTPSKCGDGITDQIANEECDDGGQTASCDVDCTLVVCGDRHANAAAGEQCDDGNATNGDGCSSSCGFEGCGDGVVDERAGEECDDGNREAGDGCSADCRSSESCGNDIVDEGEACDDGGESARCNADCTIASCGDHVHNSVAGEACDEGGMDTTTCDHDCTAPECGDQVVNAVAGEACDQGGIDTPACNRDCTEPRCGDGLVNVMAGEQCDAEGDTPECDRDCTLRLCGDRLVNESAGEACDDGGASAACDADCTVALCGDGHVNPARGESCDDGNAVPGDGCSAACRLEHCGNGTVDPGETCDDGDRDSGDGCSADCRSVEICGNGIVDTAAGEQCDDGGESFRCNADCTAAACGDFVVNAAAGETCDEGGVDTRGCDRDCTQPVCGDFVINTAAYEACDQGGVNTAACDDDCTLAVCGDSVANPAAGESCDEDGENSSTCDADCTMPVCGDTWVNVENQEQCDQGGDTASCDRDCTGVACGDGLINVAAGEQCDDRGESVRCDADCTLALCGDGAFNTLAGEACDEGGVDTATCNMTCTVPVCGDGHVNLAAGEDCESGGVDTLFCDDDCTFAWCGDGTVNPAAGEQCDDGNVDDDDGCQSNCEGSSCEDGIQNGDEEDVDCGGSCGDCGETEVMIVAGDQHTCALLETGAVRCWGYGANGRLGYGNTNAIGDNETPASAGDVDVGGPVVQLAAGGRHTCALLGTGAVRCWGRGGNGRLGYGNTNDIGDTETPASAGNVDVGGPVVQLAAGYEHTCAVLETGAVRCWGYGGNGQLGYGNTNDIGDTETPASAGDVDVGGPVVQLAAGWVHTCAVLETGAVRCWGDGGNGRLGYGNMNPIGDDETPASAGDVDVGGPVVQLAAGGYHTCALLDTGAVRCWGNGGNGRLGYGNTNNIGDTETPASAGDVDVGGPVAQLAAGVFHTCALVETGAVRCWGFGGNGRLGYGNVNEIGDNETPASAGDVDVSGPVVQLAAGYEHTCAVLETGAVRCWGHGGHGRLGYGNTTDIGDNETPASAGDVNVTETEVLIVAGGNHTCALLETGAVRCWGDGGNGQLGYGNTSDIGDNETPASAGDVNVGGPVVQLAAGWRHTCALLETGAVRCWGAGAYGRLGYGNTSDIGDNETPASAGDVDVGGRVVQLAAGSFHTCALLETGAVRCWGAGAYGQLGYGNTSNIGDNEAPATAGDVDVGGSVAQLAAGDLHTCALLETGAVRCWGYGLYGQLGYGNTNNIGDNEAPETAGDVNVGGSVAQLAAGEWHTCALLETGAVRCWGWGFYGQLGYGNTSNIGDNEAPAAAGNVNAGGPVAQLATGESHTCVLLETGAVRCWGYGAYGQLGYGNTSNIGDNEAPASAGDVNVGGPVVQLAEGDNHTCALLETGAVRCWGYGGDGRLGYGNTNNIGDNEAPVSAGDVNVTEAAAMIVAGYRHTCALLETGAVRCWGYGGHGRLGYGSTNSVGDDEVPATAGDVGMGSLVAQFAAGGGHTCALLETGGVRCWGYGANGRLGYGNTNNIGDDEVPTTAGDVNVGGPVVQLTTGGGHTCALLETGAVRCWGVGLYGQLGYGSTNNVGDDEVPAMAGDVNVGGPVVQLTAGDVHTCVLLDTGGVRCWGHGFYGPLGYGSMNSIGDNEAPATAGDVNVGGRVVQLAAGHAHTCALLETGGVRCWGYGFDGQLGYGNTNSIGDNEAPATAGDVNVGGRVVQLAAGGKHTCALLETGAVRCWGHGAYGQLGYGNMNNIGDNETPAMVGDVNVGTGVVRVAAGLWHTCALLETGEMRCWGEGAYGQLGYGNTSSIGDNETPASAGDVPYW